MSTPLIYIAPDGKVYKRSGATEYDLPEFSYTDLGLLWYRYKSTQDFHGLTINENGVLLADGLEFSIDENGEIISTVTWELVQDLNVTEAMQKNIDLLRSHNKKIKMKVELLDSNYNTISDSLVGNITGYPSYEIDSESDIRTTCTITLSLSSKEQMELDFEKTWNDRMVRLYVGLYDFGSNAVSENSRYVWYKLGTMLMSSGETVFNATTQEVKLNLVDLMASMSSERGSQIGETYLFLAGQDPKKLLEGDPTQNIKGIIAENTPFNSTNVCEFDDTVPYDLYSNSGDYAIDVLHLLFDLFPYYEFFYDRDGVFTAQEIPTKTGSAYPVEIGKEILDSIIISESKTVDFSNVKNTTEIWGRSLHGDYVAIDCTTSNDTYVVTIDQSYTTYAVGETFTVQPLTNSVTDQQMRIQQLAACYIYTVNGAETTYTKIPAGTMKGGVAYVLRYATRDLDITGTNPNIESMFILEGELQIRCIFQEITEMPSGAVREQYKAFHSCNNVVWKVNPDSPFACTLDPDTGEIKGEIRQLLRDGEYDAIYTTQLAYERASYENWLKCRNQDTVEVEMLLVPWMDVNDKIQYTSPVTGEIGTWLVTAISYNLQNWTMTVSAKRFYPVYPFYVDGEEDIVEQQESE